MGQIIRLSILFFYLFFLTLPSFAQFGNTSDSLKLPFAIVNEKRLSDEDLKEKKEGIDITGVPDLSSDPVEGFGFGAEAEINFNGKRTDPFFAYTPYRGQVQLSFFYTTKSEKEFELELDIPYIFNSQWRLRGQCTYEIDPNRLFFGVTEKSLNPLSYYPNNDSSKAMVNNASYNDYNNNLVGSAANYNTFQAFEKSATLSIEHSWFGGKVRTLLGYELAQQTMSTPLDPNSLLHQQYIKGLITGFGAGLTSEAQVGLIYDTRDLEPDPSRGSFAELTDQISSTVLGSQFNYNRLFLHYNYYHRLFDGVFRKLIFAGRAGLGGTFGNAPFYEYMDQWTSEGDIDGLGGRQTLRGYVQNRFAGPVIFLSNLELRYRFWQTDILEQHFSFAAVPFFDSGGVWNMFDRISHLENLRYSEGLGLQVGWNEDTILRFDYGISAEGAQFYFAMSKIF